MGPVACAFIAGLGLRVRRGSSRATDPCDYQELRIVPERRPRDLTSGGPLLDGHFNQFSIGEADVEGWADRMLDSESIRAIGVVALAIV